MARGRTGQLIIIGGHEDKEGDKLILRYLAQEVASGKLVVATVASDDPADRWGLYEPLFRRLGIRHVHHLELGSREEAKSDRAVRVLSGAKAVFFTGGDQLKITTTIGDTPIYERIQEIFDGGGIIAGTSAGASVMCETMLVSGPGEASHRIGAALHMAPGLGLLQDCVVDQHFAERGRMGRLVAAVAQNPRILGIGIDENTAVVVRNHSRFRVIGDGAVYVVDGSDVSYTNLTDAGQDRTLSVFDLRVHLLSQGDTFDLKQRVPVAGPAERIEEVLLGATD
jgi:cyanophycinase